MLLFPLGVELSVMLFEIGMHLIINIIIFLIFVVL